MRIVLFIGVIQIFSLLIAHQATPQLTKKASVKLDFSIEMSYNDNPLFLSIEQNTFIKTKADGFVKKTGNPPDRFRRIGKTNIAWQAKGLYEIVLYTDYFTQKQIDPIDFIGGTPPPYPLDPNNVNHLQFAVNVDRRLSPYSGLYPQGGDDPNNEIMTPCVPVKVWTQSTAGPLLDGSNDGEPTAPYTDNPPVTERGIITRLHWYGLYTPDRIAWGKTQYPNYSYEVLYVMPPDMIFKESLWPAYEASHPSDPITDQEKKHRDPCYTAIPDKNAVSLDTTNINFGQLGSYKKVIASTRFYTWPLQAELTFAIDLTDANLIDNTIYEGKIYVDLVGN